MSEILTNIFIPASAREAVMNALCVDHEIRSSCMIALYDGNKRIEVAAPANHPTILAMVAAGGTVYE